MYYIICALAAAVIIAGDRLSKLWVTANAQVGETIARLPLFNITYVRNEGAAFSILSGRLGVLSVISVLFCIGVIAYFVIKRPKHKLWCTALALMFAGALGNAWDRIFYGYVVDFIETAFIDFPVFNIADMAITIGAALMVVYAIFFDGDTKPNGDTKAGGDTEKKESVG